MKIGLTGATGFIGLHIAGELLRAGHKLRVLARNNSNLAGLKHDNVELVYGDFGDDKSLRNLVEGSEAVVHCGYYHDKDELAEPAKWFQVNTYGSFKLMEFSRLAGIKKFLFLSSGAVYGGKRQYRPVDESHACYPGGGYAAYNLSVEHYVAAYRNEFGMKGSTSLRLCGHIYGLRRPVEKSLWYDLARKAAKNEVIKVKAGVDPLSARDIGRNILVLLGMNELEDDNLILCDEHFSWREVSRAIISGVRSSSKVEELEKDAGPAEWSNTRIKFLGGNFSGLKGIEEYAGELVEKSSGGNS